MGVYCSDVSGAFDKVCADRIAAKLATLHLHPRVHALLASWLAPRRPRVVVEGAFSQPRVLSNSMFQGTVSAPVLWNCFYADASIAVQRQGFIDIFFADDLNCTKSLTGICRTSRSWMTSIRAKVRCTHGEKLTESLSTHPERADT